MERSVTVVRKPLTQTKLAQLIANGDLNPNDPSRSQGGCGRSTPMPFLGETQAQGGGSSVTPVFPPWLIREGINPTQEQRGEMRQEELAEKPKREEEDVEWEWEEDVAANGNYKKDMNVEA